MQDSTFQCPIEKSSSFKRTILSKIKDSDELVPEKKLKWKLEFFQVQLILATISYRYEVSGAIVMGYAHPTLIS